MPNMPLESYESIALNSALLFSIMYWPIGRLGLVPDRLTARRVRTVGERPA
jgi:hypothetical protein